MNGERQLARLPWGEISYLEWRPSTPRRSVLLLHGGGLDSAALSWGEVGPALARSGYHVIAPDHPGYGESPPAPWPVTQERVVAYVGEVVDALGLDDYAIGGISLGGGMTLGHVLERPQGVAGAAVLGSYGLADHQFEGWYAKPAHVLTWMLLRTGALTAATRAYENSRALMAGSVRSIIRSPERRTPELLDAVMAAAHGGQGRTAFEQWQRDQFLWNRLRTNYSDRLGSFPRPLLVIHGDRDIGVPVTQAEKAARRAPSARLVVVPGAGHWVQRDRPDIVLPALVDFLGTVA